MDDTFANQSGIPVLSSLEDIPVHSTPIKGTKIPLPSTRHPVKKPVYTHRKNVQRGGDPDPVETSRHSESENMSGQGHNAVKSQGHGHNVRETMQIQQEDFKGGQRTAEKVSASEFIETNRKTVRFSQRIIPGQDEFDASPQFVRPDTVDSLPKHYNRTDSDFQGQNYNGDIQFESGFSTPPRAKSPTPHQSHVQHNLHKQAAAELKFATDNQRPNYQGLPKPNFERNLTKPENDVGQHYSMKNEQTTEDSDRSRHRPSSTPSAYSVDTAKAKETSTRRLSLDGNKNYATGSRGDNSQTALRVETATRVGHTHRNDNSPSVRRSFNSPTVTRKSEVTGTTLSDSFKQTSFSDVETTTVHKQRQEIQLLVTELRARDQELGDTLRSHQQQLIAWEQDRQRLLSLDQRCTQHQEELQHKSSQLCTALASLKAVKSQQTSEQTQLETMRGRMENVALLDEQHKQELKEQTERCTYLQKMIDELSTTVGRLQSREEELSISLKLKEKDIVTATSEMRDLGERLRHMDQRCKERQDREREAVKECGHWKHMHNGCVSELQAVKDQMAGMTKDKAQLTEENRSLRQHLAMIQKEGGMREKCKDEIIDSMKTKQERTDAQLKHLRELYERQLREVSILHLHLDTSKDIIHKQLSSLEEQQFSVSYSSRGNSAMSEQSADHMFPGRPHTRPTSPTHTHHYRDFEPSLQQHTQSSGYQTQTSGNQSELTENQTNSLTGHQSLNPHTHIAAMQGAGYQSRLSDPFTRSSNSQSQDQGSPNSVHSRFHVSDCDQNRRLSHPPDYSTTRTSKISSCDSDAYVNSNLAITPKVPNSLPNMRTGEDTSRKHDSPRQRLSFSPTNSSNRKSGRNSPMPKDSIQLSERATSQSDSPQSVRYVIKSPIHPGANADRPLVSNGGNEKPLPSETVNIQPSTDRQSAKEDLDSRYAFENKLCAFLEEIDDIENINDSIWEEKSVGIQSANISQVEGSPGSKLQKLLLESQMMIHSLEMGRSPHIHVLDDGVSPTNKSTLQSLITPDNATKQEANQNS